MYIGQLYYTSTKLVNRTYIKQYKLRTGERSKTFTNILPRQTFMHGHLVKAAEWRIRIRIRSSFVVPPTFQVSMGKPWSTRCKWTELDCTSKLHMASPAAPPRCTKKLWSAQVSHLLGRTLKLCALPPPESASFSPQRPWQTWTCNPCREEIEQTSGRANQSRRT